MRRLFVGDEDAAEGRHVRLDGVRLRRVRSQTPPLVIGGAGSRMLRLVARHTDVWERRRRRAPARPFHPR